MDGIDAARLDTTLLGGMELLAGHSPATAVLDRSDGVAVAAAGVGGAAFNTGWVTARPADPETAIARAYDLLAGTGRPFSWHVPDEFDNVVRPVLAARGVTASTALPGMVRAATRDVPPLPTGVRIERVSDEAAVKAHALAVGIGFGAPDPRGLLDVVVPSLLGDERVAMFNGYADGGATPVATSVAAAVDGVAGIFAVTVHEAARRRGLGAAITWAAVAAGAAAGASYAALQATAMGEPVYRRMGFAAIRDYHRYDAG